MRRATKASPTITLQIQLPVEVAGELAAFTVRHGGDLSNFCASTLKRAAEEIARFEGMFPRYGDAPQKVRRATFSPGVV